MGSNAKNQGEIGPKNRPESDELSGTPLDRVTRPEGPSLNQWEGLFLVNFGVSNLFDDSTGVQIDAESSLGANPWRVA